MKDPCATRSCTTDAPPIVVSPSLPLPDDLALPNITTPNFQLQGCRQYGLGLDAPRAAVAPLVPGAFGLVSITTETGRLVVWINHCDEAFAESRSLGPATFYNAFVAVYPVNESWTKPGFPNYFAIESTVDNLQLSDFLRRQGLRPAAASLEIMSPAAGVPRAEHVTVKAADWNVRFDVTLEAANNPHPAMTFRAHMWSGTGPFQRVAYAETADQIYMPTAGEVLADGAGRLAATLPGGASPYAGGYATNVLALYDFEGQWMV